MLKWIRYIIVGLMLQSGLLKGQNLTYADYITNGSEVFSEIDSQYVQYFLKELNITSLTEKKYNIDTLGQIKDSVILNHYSFDSLGRVVEHRFDYRFNSTKYRVTNYSYYDGDSINKTFTNPFGQDILSGIFVSERPIMSCEHRNDSYQIETIQTKSSVDGETFTMNFYYNPSFFVRHYYYKQYLISRLDFLEGDKLKYKHVIEYK